MNWAFIVHFRIYFRGIVYCKRAQRHCKRSLLVLMDFHFPTQKKIERISISKQFTCCGCWAILKYSLWLGTFMQSIFYKFKQNFWKMSNRRRDHFLHEYQVQRYRKLFTRFCMKNSKSFTQANITSFILTNDGPLVWTHVIANNPHAHTNIYSM